MYADNVMMTQLIKHFHCPMQKDMFSTVPIQNPLGHASLTCAVLDVRPPNGSTVGTS